MQILPTLRGSSRRRSPVAPTRPADLHTACGAPHASMYFAPDGQVRACCVNTNYTLGRIGQQTIREIWEGARIAALRQALDGHDYSLGCQDCEHRVAAGDRDWSTAAQYDPYASDLPGEFPRRMDFILSITCNLQCAMCDGELSSSIRMHREKRPPMPPAYSDAFFDELRDFLPHLERSVFLGGEPFVAREPQRVWDLMIEQGLTAPVQVVTNGTQWNAKVERFLRELPMSLAVSADGFSAGTLEALRVGVDRDKLFRNVDRYQEAVAASGGTVSFHFCLMRQNWHEFGTFLLESDRRGAHTLIMTVTGPAGFSLWDLPEADLRDVLASLEREEETLAPRLGLNRPVWDAELDRIRRHLVSIEGGALPAWLITSWAPPAEVPVTFSQPSADDRADDLSDEGEHAAAALDEFEQDLVAWAGRPPLVLVVVGGLITGVEAEPWAAALDPAAWVGRAPEELAVLLADRLGTGTVPEVTDHAGGVVTAETAFHPDGVGEVRFRSVVSPRGLADGGGLRIALATDAEVEWSTSALS